MNSYELSRNYFDWCFENPEKITPNHTAIYFFAIEHCNRLGWKNKFGLPSQMVMDAIGIKNWRTYIKAFNDLTEWGFFELVEKSKNQYSSNIIAIVKNTKANTKALDKAMQTHIQKQSKSIASIDKPINLLTIKPINQLNIIDSEKSKRFIPPTLQEVEIYCFERNNGLDPKHFIDHYTSNGWLVGKNKMKDWQSAIRNWERTNKKFNQTTNNNGNKLRNQTTDEGLRAFLED